MWKLVIGFASGVYIGTYYDCKPIIEKLQKKLTEIQPPKK
jgi:hypothetical protein